VLDTGDTLRGQVKYSMQDDVVELKAGNKLETYSARKIITFDIFDVTIKQYRQFYTVPCALKGQYKAPAIFELLNEGKMTLLTRESIEVRTYNATYGYGQYSRLVLINKYYLLKEDGNVVDILPKKNDFLERMGSKAELVQQFIKDNKISFDRKYDIAKAVKYYNSLF
jgi:hypothetical protein